MLFFSVLALPATGTVYKFVDGNGITHYTNIRPQRKNYNVVSLHCIHMGIRCGSTIKMDWYRVPLNHEAFGDEVAIASKKYDVDRSLIRAVIHAESSFNRLAVSEKGAQGLMQLMPIAQRHYKVQDAFSAAANIDGGTRIIRDLINRFGKDTRLVLAAYHAGPGAVNKYHGVPPYASTREYIGRVQILHRRYKKG